MTVPRFEETGREVIAVEGAPIDGSAVGGAAFEADVAEASRTDDGQPENARVASGPKEAVVSAVLGPRTVRLMPVDARSPEAREATLAVAGDYRPAVGDSVLVLSEVAPSGGTGRTWVIGVVRSLRSVSSDPVGEGDDVLRATDGTSARVSADRDTLTVSDSGGAVLFTHCARTGQSTVSGRGVLSLQAPMGDIDLVAGGAVRLAGERVEVFAKRDFRVSTPDGNALSLDREGATLAASAVRVTAARGRLSLKDATLAVERLETAVGKARHFVGVLETRATRIVEHAHNVFREVEDLSQVRAGRVRTVARGTWSVLSRRSTVKAEEDLVLLGDKIHLA